MEKPAGNMSLITCKLKSRTIKAELSPWATAVFFPGGGGHKHTICLKNALKHTIFFRKCRKHTISAGLGGGGQVPPLALPCGRP